MTKVAEAKPAATAAKANTPFFNKGGDALLLTDNEHPFFTKQKDALSVQPKLTVGQPNDKYEKEADTVADNVVQRLATSEVSSKNEATIQAKPSAPVITPLVQTKCASCEPEEKLQKKEDDLIQEAPLELQRKPIFESNAGPPDDENIQRKCEACDQKEELRKKEEEPVQESSIELQRKPIFESNAGLPDDENIQRKCAACDQEEKLQKKSNTGDSSASPDIESSLNASKGSGSPLPSSTRKQMEHSIGADFSGVRIHTGSAATKMTENMNAQAFAHKNDIYFNTGKYDTSSSSGKHLLAHELTHTVQQGASLQRKPSSDTSEKIVPSHSPYGNIVQYNLLDDAKAGAGAAWDTVSGGVANVASDLILDQMQSLSPSLVLFIKEIRAGGVANFFKGKLMEGVNGIFNGLQNNSAAITTIFPAFAELIPRAKLIIQALASGDCKPLFAAMNDLKELVTTLAGNAWDAIVEFFQPAIDFFTDLWNSFALPALEWLKEKAAGIWNWIKEIGGKIWGWFSPLREALGEAWDYIKGILGLNADETGQEGLIQWAQRKAGEVWEAIKEELRPIIEPAKAMIARIKEIIPLSAILNLRKTIQDWLKNVIATSGAMGDDASNVGNEAAQTSLRDQILPAIQQSIESFRGSITDAAAWVNGKIGEVFSAVSQFFTSVKSISLISFAGKIIGWLETKVSDLNNWIQSKVTSLFDMVSQGLHSIGGFLQPVYDALVKILGVLGNILGMLPDFLMGPLWMLLPDCIKEPIKKFFLEQILGRMEFFKKLQALENIWEKLEAMAITILKQIFIDGNLKKAIWTFFSSMMDMLGLPPTLVTKVISKAAQFLSDVLDDPLGFLINFVHALKLGFNQFFNKIGTYLLSGLQGWLLGKLAGTGIEMPTEFSFKSMLKFAFQVLGITVDMLLTKLEEVTGKKGLKAKIEKVIGVISNAFEWLEKLMSNDEEGGSFWDRLEKSIGSIWDFILDAVVGWLETNIVVQALKWVATKLDPTGIMTVITTIIDVYNVVNAIMEKAKEIFEMIDKILDGLGDLIKGVIGAAATVFEHALGAAVPVVMAILSSLFGLDGVVDKVKEAIEKLRAKVEEGVKKIMTSIKGWILKLFGKGDEKDGKDDIKNAMREIDQEGKEKAADGEVTKGDADQIAADVKRDHPSVIDSITVMDGGENWDFEYVQLNSGKTQLPKKKLATGEHQKILGILETGNAKPARKIICHSGTLDDRIGGKVGDGMQAHHMISCSVAEKSTFAKAAAESGYDINRKENGILLPSSRKKWDAVKKKRNGAPLPLHRGGHIEKYYELVSEGLEAKQGQAAAAAGKNKPWTDIMLVEEMSDVELIIADKLLKYEILLSNNDPSIF